MRACMFALAFGAALAGSLAYGHGPQIQITIDPDADQIVTREIIPDEDYFNALTTPKKVYVLPAMKFTDSAWYSRPNNAPHATIPGLPKYFSGPGITYGYDRADGGTQDFAQSSSLLLNFTDGLKLWDGVGFGDAGPTQLKAFTGSDINAATNFAVTVDGGASANVTAIASVPLNYNGNAHGSVRFGLLGDGSSPTSLSPSGVYLASLQYSSTQSGLNPSDEFLFVLAKKSSYETIVAAVESLGYAPGDIQWLVPEPGSLTLLSIGAFGLTVARRRRLRQRKRG